MQLPFYMVTSSKVAAGAAGALRQAAQGEQRWRRRPAWYAAVKKTRGLLVVAKAGMDPVSWL